MKTKSLYINSIVGSESPLQGLGESLLLPSFLQTSCKEAKMVIYCVENLLNSKRYVGQSSHFNSDEEFQKSNYWGSGIAIGNAIKKYGKENFRKWVLIHGIETKEQLDHYEKLCIKRLNTKKPNGYNLTDGGDGGFL